MHHKHPTRQTKQHEFYKLTRMCLSRSESKMGTNARKREVHHLSPEILSVWWPCCWTAWASAPRKSAAAEAAERMAMAKTHRLIFFWIPPPPHEPLPLPTEHPLSLCVSNSLLSSPNPLCLPPCLVWSNERGNPHFPRG